MSAISRRQLFKAAALLAGAGAVSTTLSPAAGAQPGVLGKVVDFAAGVPSASSIKAAGFMGAVRYVSRPRPGTEGWMKGKPVSLRETQALAAAGLPTASVYQFGKAETADWKQGAAGAAVHAPQAIALHAAAGGPRNRPIYVAIDDNPTRQQYEGLIRPYLQAFAVALRAAGHSMGIYGNYFTLEWAIADGLGEFFWQHNWGSQGRIHPRAHLHQVSIDKQSIDGVGIDVNHVYASDWGQWTPGSGLAVPLPAPGAPGQNQMTGDLGQISSNPQIAQLINQANQAVQDFLRRGPGALSS